MLITLSGFAVVLIAAVVEMPWMMQSFFRVSAETAIAACRIGALAGVLVLLNRMLATLLQRVGCFAALSAQSGVRIVVYVALMLTLVVAGFPAATAGALAVAVAEVMLSLWLAWVLRGYWRPRGGAAA